MTSKEKKGLEQWLEQHATEDQQADPLRKIWQATGTYREQYQPDVDKGLAAFKARMRDEAPVTGKVVRLRPMTWLARVAAAAVLLIGAAFLFKMAFPVSVPTENIAAETGAQKTLMLKDGTSVTLNETSNLTFPQDFTKNERRVELAGEAFFDVANDASKPFIVGTELAEIMVLGTSFNIRAYPGEGAVEVYVKTGKVAVILKSSGTRVELNPGEKVVFEKKSGSAVSSTDDTGNALAWKEGTLFFKQKTFREIFSEIERQFGVQINAKNEQLLNCSYTLTVEKGKLEEGFNAIQISCPVQFTEVSPKSFTVSGTCCK